MLTDDDVQTLNRRAREVGGVIGWDLQFVVAPNSEYVGLAAGGGADHADEIIVIGPSRITDLAVYEIDPRTRRTPARRTAHHPRRRRQPPPDLNRPAAKD